MKRDIQTMELPRTVVSVLFISSVLLILLSSCSTIPPPPITEDSYTNLQFSKIINPAFHDDVRKKWVHCQVRFLHMNDRVAKLPREYQRKWVSFFIGDMTRHQDIAAAVIPKEKSNLLPELKSGEPIEIFAYLEPTVLTISATWHGERTIKESSGLSVRAGAAIASGTSRNQRGRLFRVEKIKRLSK